ncbi:MAG: hypothetical protein OEY33_05000 [Bdellovibrionales bacterium]|nr:hypothetical protein [Bdellovibrionales bacterium]
MSDFLDDKSVNQEIKIKLYQFVYNLSVKRDVQLTTLSTENRNSSFFYQLDINKRGIIYLRDRSQLLLSEIELIVGRRNYEIINDYELAKNLVQLKEQRPL